MMSRRILGLVSSLPLLAACAVSSGPEQSASSPAQAAAEPTYTRTVVHVGADGAPVVTTESVTASEQKARIEALSTARVGETGGASKLHPEGCPPGGCGGGTTLYAGSCTGSSLWMFDDWSFNGNELCVFNANGVTATLNYTPIIREWMCGSPLGCHPYFWGGAVRSYYSGSQSGVFSGGFGSYAFPAWDEEMYAPSYAVMTATQVTLNP